MAEESLSTVFLIAVVLVGSLAVYSVVAPIFSTRIASCVAVDWAEAQVNPTEAIVVLNIKNTSPKHIRMVELIIYVDGCDIARFNVDILPGSSSSVVIRNPPGTWYAGEAKNAVVTAVFADGSASSSITSIKVSGTSWVGIEEEPLKLADDGEQSEEGDDSDWSDSDSGGQDNNSSGQDNNSGGQGVKTVIFVNDFSTGLSGWRPWGTAIGLTVEVDKHGRPSPCLHVYAKGPIGSLAGASKEVDVDFQSPAQLRFAFDYNVHALRDRGEDAFPGNLWVRVEASGNILVDEKIYEARSSDSGWKSAAVTIPPVTGRITLIIYTQMLSSRTQEFWFDNVVLEG